MPFVKVDEVIHRCYDYIIVGGGTAGLVVATRLSENPSVSVLVLEAGEENLEDPKIDMLAQIAHTFGDPKYDWNFPIAQQKRRAVPSPPWQRGKGLGGSSAMNFYCWMRPPAQDIDALEALGNPGWNWADYVEYSKKVETFHPATKEQPEAEGFCLSNPAFRGDYGPVHIINGPHFHTIDAITQRTFINRGIKHLIDPYGGNITGAFMASSNIDSTGWKRSYSTTAYLLPNIGRQNIHVLTNALVSRVLFNKNKVSDEVTAVGVELIHASQTFVSKARIEVILSAGAIKTPHILELSGIGRSDVLKSIGVDVLVDLPGVGENVQEHVGSGICFELNSPHDTFDFVRDPIIAAKHRELYLQGKGFFRNSINSFAYFPLSAIDTSKTVSIISTLQNEIKELKAQGKLTPRLEAQLKIQLQVYQDDDLPDCEIVAYAGLFSPLIPFEPGKSYVSLVPILNHPISRGTIHAKNDNPLDHPIIDPHYFDSDVDLEMMVQQVKFARCVRDTEPLKSLILKEVGSSVDASTDDELREWIRNNAGTVWHTIGSCSMLPRDMDGVVDSNLKVYGTKNLRVADLSILPLHIAAHTQATAYVIGEKAADFIKAEYKV